MRCIRVIVMLLAMPIVACAAEKDDRDAQIAAAKANAVESLRKQISDETIIDKITVKDLLDKTIGTQMLTDTLFRAEQIGGPRFNEHRCDIWLEISGSRVRQALQQIAAKEPKRSPISADQLAIRLRDWDKKNFSAFGSSAGAAAVNLIKPSPDERVWVQIPDENRKEAVFNAKVVATTQAMAPVASVPIAGGKTVSDAMAVKSVKDRMEKWLGSRPITQVEFRDDKNVRVTLAAPADEAFEQLRLALTEQKTLSLPKDETAWMSVKQDFVNNFKAPAGIAAATTQSTTVPQVAGMALKLPKPDWAQQQLDAEASVKQKGALLMSARVAESTARDNLKAKLEALPLGDGKTIGEAAKSDEHLRDMVAKNVKDAGIRKTEYLPDGTVKSRVYLDLQNFWRSVSEEQ